jgi:hypothetical protein
MSGVKDFPKCQKPKYMSKTNATPTRHAYSIPDRRRSPAIIFCVVVSLTSRRLTIPTYVISKTTILTPACNRDCLLFDIPNKAFLSYLDEAASRGKLL